MDKTQETADEKSCMIKEKNNELSIRDSNCLQPITRSNSREKITNLDVIPQVIASCIIHCVVIQVGVNMAYSTVLLNDLKLDNAGMTITENEESWIASLVTITLPIGSIIAGPLMDKFGRKVVCSFSCVPAIISWILFIFAKSVITIYAARFIAGIAAGLSTVGVIYVSELSHPQIRPMLLCLNSVFVSLGILITCCLAISLDWHKMAIVFLALECCIFFALFFLPESPYWLACFGNGMLDEKRTREMKRSLKRLNRTETIYEQEYSRIMEIARNRVALRHNETSDTVVASIKNYYHKFKSPSAYKPITILFVLFLLQQLSGCYVVIFYAMSVFDEMSGILRKSFNENSAFVMLGIVRFVVSILTSFSSRKYGRRVICILSGIGMSVSMFLSGIYMHFTVSSDKNGNEQEIMVDYKWLLLVFVLSYICFSTFGFTTIPWTQIGELIPVSIRGIGGGFMVSVAYIMMFAVIKSYPYILKSIGIGNIFFLFSFTSLLSIIYVYFFVPETLNKSFSDIEKMFTSNKEEKPCDVHPT
ncbi:PREDICTED: facilitated trehalose transporter Tret1 isoform X4 [Dinoponera quadriceps]|uniref:Facilitated trehalose transporter Tret1 isoform X4 n=1 Tax=Dinoponera quadriceps TaxID=609295 RepID=A0A6P3XC58_DINQU|nr:PREDICTED: facilitated trehalose transporter Tret1 isoform X4 [Dinoponera quadriceps]